MLAARDVIDPQETKGKERSIFPLGGGGGMRQRKTKLPPFLEEATQQRGEHGGPHADFFPLFLLLLINKSCMREESRHVCFDYLLESACFFFPQRANPTNTQRARVSMPVTRYGTSSASVAERDTIIR